MNIVSLFHDEDACGLAVGNSSYSLSGTELFRGREELGFLIDKLCGVVSATLIVINEDPVRRGRASDVLHSQAVAAAREYGVWHQIPFLETSIADTKTAWCGDSEATFKDVLEEARSRLLGARTAAEAMAVAQLHLAAAAQTEHLASLAATAAEARP